MSIKTFVSFGFEGSIVSADVNISAGTEQAVNIHGLADSAVKDVCDCTRSAIENSGYTMPEGVTDVILSPVDIKKSASEVGLAVALAVLQAQKNVSKTVNVMVYGALGLSGSITPLRGTYVALATAKSQGISYAIIPEGTEKVPDGLRVVYVKNLVEAFNALCDIESGKYLEAFTKGFITDMDSGITFKPLSAGERPVTEMVAADASKTGLVYAVILAAAGRLNILAYGPPGCGKSEALQGLSQFAPNLISTEQESVNRIYSIAGLTKPGSKIVYRPFRIPHQTASIEGICGGGVDCRPGEITLAHKGTLFLDEAAEFKTSVLQMLRVPLESRTITLSRAGRSTVYPADFQLAMATNPCPCGNYGSKDKVCLCSAKSIEQYWKKFTTPLLDRVAIRYNCNRNIEPYGIDYVKDFEHVRNAVITAVKCQYYRQSKMNGELTPEEVKEHCKMTDRARAILDEAIVNKGLSPRAVDNILRTARTILDVQGFAHSIIGTPSITKALELYGDLTEVYAIG